MAQQWVRKFIDALKAVEASDDERTVAAMAALFSEEATLSNAAASRSYDGRQGAAEFWHSYRKSFDTVRSEFRRVMETHEGAALEWDSDAVARSGRPLRYSGVSLIDFSDDGISRFRAYFDPAALERKASAELDSGDDVPAAGGDALRGDENIPDDAPSDLSYASPGRTPY